MRLTRLFVALALAPLVLAVPAAAQVPDTGLIGVSGNFGVFFPDETQEKAVTLDGQVDWYLTPRISVRGLFGWTSPGFENRTEDHFRQVRLQFNGVYNWEFREWHPYATAGAGAYFVRQILDGRDDPDSETRGGINFGGGVEYFTSDMMSVKGELRFDVVSHPPGLPDATGFTITIGLKRYF
jgi:opacity protein-like surface antigen